jgi:hypothetical protein
MRRNIVIGLCGLLAVLVVVLVMGCQGRDPYQDPGVIIAREKTERTDIREAGQTERTGIRESGQTARAELAAEQSLNMLLLAQEQNNHDETMFRLYSLALLASSYDNLGWIVLSFIAGAIVGAVVYEKIVKGQPRTKKKKKSLWRKMARAFWKEFVDLTSPDYFHHV